VYVRRLHWGAGRRGERGEQLTKKRELRFRGGALLCELRLVGWYFDAGRLSIGVVLILDCIVGDDERAWAGGRRVISVRVIFIRCRSSARGRGHVKRRAAGAFHPPACKRAREACTITRDAERPRPSVETQAGILAI
jgi:hypothetical protein